MIHRTDAAHSSSLARSVSGMFVSLMPHRGSGGGGDHGVLLRTDLRPVGLVIVPPEAAPPTLPEFDPQLKSTQRAVIEARVIRAAAGKTARFASRPRSGSGINIYVQK